MYKFMHNLNVTYQQMCVDLVHLEPPENSLLDSMPITIISTYPYLSENECSTFLL